MPKKTLEVGDTLTKAQAKKLAPDYVAFVDGDFKKWKTVSEKFDALKRGQKCITFDEFGSGGYKVVKISSINHNDFRAIDGPIVRVSDKEYSWRVDGDRYAWPI